MTGNIGEWSELYTLFKLLAEGKLFAADENTSKIDEIYYEILKVIRKQTDGTWNYTKNINVEIMKEGAEDVIVIPISEFANNTKLLLSSLKANKKKDGAFELPNTWSFAEKIKCNTIKAKSTDKADITIKVHDAVVGSEPTLDFSIKSQLGSPSTLLNASSATNFTYKITGHKLNIEEIKKFDDLIHFKDKFDYLKSLGVEIVFKEIDNMSLKFNLMLVDTNLPTFMSEILKSFYEGKASRIVDLTNELKCKNLLNLLPEQVEIFYSHKIKELLMNIALGMVPSKKWNGNYDATGGYIIVKDDGDVLCYHIYNRNQFREYLFKNTKLETPSKSRHKFGMIENTVQGQILKLNLQIRFVK